MYNWHAIPLVNYINFDYTSEFSIKNLRIKDNNFVIGIIKKTAVDGLIRTPWKTTKVVCFESHAKENESGVIY